MKGQLRLSELSVILLVFAAEGYPLSGVYNRSRDPKSGWDQGDLNNMVIK